LIKANETLTSNWEKYDSFTFEPKKETTDTNPKIDAKRVSANRKYLSDNKTKIPLLIAAGKNVAADRLLAEMQKRYNEMHLNGETFAADQLSELKAIGLIIGEPGETTVNPESGTQIPSEEGNDITPAVTGNEEGTNAGSGE